MRAKSCRQRLPQIAAKVLCLQPSESSSSILSPCEEASLPLCSQNLLCDTVHIDCVNDSCSPSLGRIALLEIFTSKVCLEYGLVATSGHATVTPVASPLRSLRRLPVSAKRRNRSSSGRSSRRASRKLITKGALRISHAMQVFGG